MKLGDEARDHHWTSEECVAFVEFEFVGLYCTRLFLVRSPRSDDGQVALAEKSNGARRMLRRRDVASQPHLKARRRVEKYKDVEEEDSAPYVVCRQTVFVSRPSRPFRGF